MKTIYLLVSVMILALSCTNSDNEPRVVEDFNYNWRFHLGDGIKAYNTEFDDSKWKELNLPHDWSIEEGYQNVEGTAASTGRRDDRNKYQMWRFTI